MESIQFGSQLLPVVVDRSVVDAGTAMEVVMVVSVPVLMGPVVPSVVALVVVVNVVESAALLAVLVVLLVVLVLLVLLVLLIVLAVLDALVVLVALVAIMVLATPVVEELVLVVDVLLVPIPTPTHPTEPGLHDENDATLGPTNH